ncbi:hypothetical protein ABZ468_07100 [Streptomyces sp. NPDC005708]|uniref:hypothetical protein n=1 Tax=unclassified Streptomyces TaxID=2593676 RepID=UPI0033EAD269
MARRREEATMGSRRTRGPGIARLSALCAVLVGLFLMHGAPTAAADGCHGQMRATLPTYDAHASSMASAHAMPAEPDDAQAEPADDMRSHGDLCVAIPAQNQIPLPTAPLVAVVTPTVLAAWILQRAWSPGGTGRRGPPGGRDLLLQVCIART